MSPDFLEGAAYSFGFVAWGCFVFYVLRSYTVICNDIRDLKNSCENHRYEIRSIDRVLQTFKSNQNKWNKDTDKGLGDLHKRVRHRENVHSNTDRRIVRLAERIHVLEDADE